MERVPRLERVVLGGGSRNTLRSKPNLGRQRSGAQALSCPGSKDRDPRKEISLQKIKDRGTASRYNFPGKILGMGFKTQPP